MAAWFRKQSVEQRRMLLVSSLPHLTENRIHPECITRGSTLQSRKEEPAAGSLGSATAEASFISALQIPIGIIFWVPADHHLPGRLMNLAEGMESPPECQHDLRLFVPQLRSQTVNRLFDLGDDIRRQVHLADGKCLAYRFQRNSSKGGGYEDVGVEDNLNHTRFSRPSSAPGVPPPSKRRSPSGSCRSRGEDPPGIPSGQGRSLRSVCRAGCPPPLFFGT